jgi:hypothetical protein
MHSFAALLRKQGVAVVVKLALGCAFGAGTPLVLQRCLPQRHAISGWLINLGDFAFE